MARTSKQRSDRYRGNRFLVELFTTKGCKATAVIYAEDYSEACRLAGEEAYRMGFILEGVYDFEEEK